MNRRNYDQNHLLQHLRDHLPNFVLSFLENVVVVLRQPKSQLEKINKSAIHLIRLFNQTNNIIKTLLKMNPFPLRTRTSLDFHTDLEPLYCLTVKTVYFLAGYGAVLERWETNMLLRKLAVLIAVSLKSLRNYSEMCFFGKEFATRVRNAICVNQDGLNPISGARRFFDYILQLAHVLQQPRKLQNICLEVLLGNLPFPSDENIENFQGPIPSSLCRTLMEFRFTGGLPVLVDPDLLEQFSTAFGNPNPVQIESYRGSLRLYTFG